MSPRVYIHGKDGQSEPGAPRVTIHGPPAGLPTAQVQVQGQQQTTIPAVLSALPQVAPQYDPPPMSVFQGNVLFLAEDLVKSLGEIMHHLDKIAKSLDDISTYVKGPTPAPLDAKERDEPTRPGDEP